MTARCTWYAIQGPNGDLIWRVIGPAEAVEAKLNLIPETEGMDVWWPNSGDFFPWHTVATEDDGTVTTCTSEAEWKAFVAKPRRLKSIETVYTGHEGEAAVFTRPMGWLATHGLELRRQGVRVCAELDDNYLSPSKLNVMFQIAGSGRKEADEHARSICSTDAVLFSTEYLRDQYAKELRERFPREKLPELHVCRNHVAERQIPTIEPYDGPIRVGYMGSDSHIWDVDLIYPALRAAKEAGCRIMFWGIHPMYVNPRYSRRKWDWAALDYEHIPWRMNYHGGGLPFDIGLAPLITNTHTLCKSDIKPLEYGLSGAACVAQNNLVYNRTLKHGEHCLLAGSPEDFLAMTMRLVKDETLRRELAANTQAYIRKERMLADNRDEWEQAIYGA